MCLFSFCLFGGVGYLEVGFFWLGWCVWFLGCGSRLLYFFFVGLSFMEPFLDRSVVGWFFGFGFFLVCYFSCLLSYYVLFSC